MLKKLLQMLLGALVTLALAVAIYFIPPVHDRLAWRFEELYSRIQYALNPPEKVVFVPQGEAQATALPTPTLLAAPTATATPSPVATLPADLPPSPTPTITLSPTALPAQVTLTGIKHEYQKWNNCGPATLAMALSFWGWQGDGVGDLQTDIAPLVKPNERDKNVMPYELADFVNTHTDLRAVVRMGGDMELLKRLLAAGFPVMVEKGFDVPEERWMGHYTVINAYDDARARFTTQDSYINANHPVAYDQALRDWRAFNYTFLLIYPPEREAEVISLLGVLWDETAAFQLAAQRASEEIFSQSGRDEAFAWYNRGTSLVMLQDYAGAAQAYDEYFRLYASLEEDQRPYRIIWYQTGPYWAYFYSGRYYDVINLASATLDTINEPAIEETYYWRAMARAALGDTTGAIEDYRLSLEWHPGFEPAIYQLALLGVED